jgi:hypothetical protein
MSALRHRSAQRARCERELQGVLDAHSAVELGNRLGHAGQTITRRGCEIRNWPADELMDLASDNVDLRTAVIDLLNDQFEAPGQAHRVVPELFQFLNQHGEDVAELSKALADGLIDAREARIIRKRRAERRIFEEQLDRDLLAIERGDR